MPTLEQFYQNLPVYRLPLAELLGRENYFVSVPPEWYVIVIDVEGSTRAVAAGRHHDVNLIATGGIIAVLNRIRTAQNIDLPYFFGGDGATFLVPPSRYSDLMQTLQAYRQHVKATFDLVLRVGGLPLTEVYEAGNELRIARCRLNDYLILPVVLGNGLKAAEATIKRGFVAAEDPDAAPVDLEGMECRWHEILPPRDEEQILCLLISAEDEARQGEIYRDVIAKIEAVFGQLDRRQPISAARLRLNRSLATVQREMRARLGRFDPRYLLKNWLANLYGPRYFKNSPVGRSYLQKISELTNTIMLDGNINTVISGRATEIAELLSYLDKLEAEGAIIYGAHATHASVMSCYVRDHDRDHIHFVDGTEGGYTAAARMFKEKLG